MTVVCGTGHRPNTLGGYSIDAAYKVELVAIDWLDAMGGDARENLLIISGGALGWDQALARAAGRWGVAYDMYLPFPDFDCKWPESSRIALRSLCNLARNVVVINDGPYAGWKMQARNEAMVNAADLVLALWNGTDGGTANCIKYASKKGKPITNLWDKFNEEAS